MIRIIVMAALFLPLEMVLAQTYQTGYTAKAYSQPSYEQPRTYPLDAYRPAEENLPCVTCNHCQVPAAAFNPNFPLVLLSFRAERVSPEQVELKWNWVSDQRPREVRLYFKDEESTEFVLIESWTNGQQKEYFHSNVAQEETYYHLEILDNEGKSHLSRVRMVEGGFHSAYMSVYPNPAHEQIFVRLWGVEGGKFQMNIFDLSGRICLTKRLTLSDGEIVAISDIQHLKTGMYIIELKGVQGRFRKKLMKGD